MQLLPFFLAARSATGSVQDLLGEALSSSYEAFRYTRNSRDMDRDEEDEPSLKAIDLSHAGWYLSEFDRALEQASGASHPKISATVTRAVDLWEAGEKVLVFAFYRRTCQALRVHISREIERRHLSAAQERLRATGQQMEKVDVDRLIERVQRRFFDDTRSPGRRAVDAALQQILQARAAAFAKAGMTDVEQEELLDVMRRFLRVATTLVRCFPLEEEDRLDPTEAVARMLDREDASGITWKRKYDDFVEFLTERCSTEQRKLFMEAAQRTQTRGIRVEEDEDQDNDADIGATMTTLANVQVATGRTKRDARSRLMRAFNTPFFPDILVCSEVMGEGVDLQRFCRHVIHHDLAWNPSTIEQRTGRIDRLGCKAEGREPIAVYLPYIAGAADERQYSVMMDRERWFRVVMGQEEVARLIRPDAGGGLPLPEAIADELSFHLAVDARQRDGP
jgi:ERCC4-related helicase